ncbi:MAG: hypothetical protein V4695_07655 [Pseudomonadota bacterium]
MSVHKSAAALGYLIRAVCVVETGREQPMAHIARPDPIVAFTGEVNNH